jgi:hypothetical protein
LVSREHSVQEIQAALNKNREVFQKECRMALLQKAFAYNHMEKQMIAEIFKMSAHTLVPAILA